MFPTIMRMCFLCFSKLHRQVLQDDPSDNTAQAPRLRGTHARDLDRSCRGGRSLQQASKSRPNWSPQWRTILGKCLQQWWQSRQFSYGIESIDRVHPEALRVELCLVNCLWSKCHKRCRYHFLIVLLFCPKDIRSR